MWSRELPSQQPVCAERRRQLLLQSLMGWDQSFSWAIMGKHFVNFKEAVASIYKLTEYIKMTWSFCSSLSLIITGKVLLEGCTGCSYFLFQQILPCLKQRKNRNLLQHMYHPQGSFLHEHARPLTCQTARDQWQRPCCIVIGTTLFTLKAC